MESDGSPSEIHNENQTSEGTMTVGRSTKSLVMYKAALKGDWQTAEMLLGLCPDLAHAEITRAGETALHVAASMKHTKFVQELAKKMESNLGSQNADGYTALYYAAASGIEDIASAMMKQHKNLPEILPKKRLHILHMAVLFGNEETVKYFQENTQVKDSKFEIFVDIIRNRMYDAALRMLEDNGNLATEANNNDGTALHVLAQHEISDISTRQQEILERLVTMSAAVPCPSWLKEKFKQPLMRRKARLLVETLLNKQSSFPEEDMLKVINKPHPILHYAARAGNVEFITLLARTDPDLIWDTKEDDKNNYTIFHIAVLNRQENVFRLIRQVGVMKDVIAAIEDKKCNNILHLVGKMPHPSRLSVVSGAALQMQRELMWFKEMEKILPSFVGEKKNTAGLRPRELFSKKHAALLKEGEKWMRDTANSCMLIATLMLTVAFTAAFTVPGGNNSDTGIPVLLKKSWFKVFLASDAVAIICATSSIMMFLSILTSRFQEDDFLLSLPRKLLFGLLGLFISLVGTGLAFTSAYFLMLNAEWLWLPIMLGCFYAVVTLVFVYQHYALFVDMIKSTLLYGKLLRPSKHSLY